MCGVDVRAEARTLQIDPLSDARCPPSAWKRVLEIVGMLALFDVDCKDAGDSLEFPGS